MLPKHQSQRLTSAESCGPELGLTQGHRSTVKGSEMKETLRVSVSACSGHKHGNQFTHVILVIAVSEFGGMHISR